MRLFVVVYCDVENNAPCFGNRLKLDLPERFDEIFKVIKTPISFKKKKGKSSSYALYR